MHWGMKDLPGVWSGTVIEANTPGVLGWTDGNVRVPGVSTARPPTILSSLGIVPWSTVASPIGERNIRDVDPIEFLHPNRHLVGEESWRLL